MEDATAGSESLPGAGDGVHKRSFTFTVLGYMHMHQVSVSRLGVYGMFFFFLSHGALLVLSRSGPEELGAEAPVERVRYDLGSRHCFS